MRSKQLVVTVVAVVFLASCSWASAGLIPYAISGATGQAFQQGDSPDPGDGSISRILDGSGLTVGDPGDSSTWTHNSAWQDNWQGSGSFAPIDADTADTSGAWLVVDLGAIETDLSELWIWNVREILNRGAKAVEIQYADAELPPFAWSSLGNFTIPQATGPDTPADIVIDLSSVPSARFFAFDIQTNWGSDFRVGFAEMQFTVVPEPSSALLAGLILAFVGLLSGKRRR